MKRIHHRRPIAAALALGSVVVATIVLAPRVSHAWVEATRVMRPMPPGACVRQESGFTHSSQDHSSITLTASLFGFNPDCRTFNSSILIAGTVRYALLKKSNTSATSTSYSYCRIGALTVPLTGNSASVTFAAPPCGPGYYAVAMCVQDATAWQRSRFNWLQQIGSLSACSDLATYNVTPSWHPVFDTTIQVGPAVVWP